jgi:parvulin-like peptidyl-prolyl isomerase
VNSNGQIVKVLDEDGKEKIKVLTTSQPKEYNKMLRNTYSSFVNSIEEDFRDSLSDEEKKKLADFLLKKSKDITNWEYFASKIPSKGSDIKEMIDAEKERIKGILSYGDSPYSFVFDAMSKPDNILTPKAIDPQENE